MATTNTISQQLLDLLATRNFHPEMLDRMGKPSNAEDAKTFTFDYISGAGKNYGTMVIVLDSDNEMKIMYGDNLGRTMEGDDKSEFFDFLQHLNQKATSNRWTHSIADINQLKHTMQGMAAIQEGLFEGYYGTRKVSYAGEPTQARLQIVHSQPLGEGDARYRHIDRMFIETAEGEKFKLGFKSLSGARAMLEHVRQGGKPYDIRGCHITETVNEIAVLSRFNRASANRILEGVTQELVTEAQVYYQTLRENLKHIASGRGYAKYFESWHPATINEQEGVVDNIKTLFIEQSIDSRIEAALPLLAKIQQRGQNMKEADIFENWINNLAEGTWTLPETPEQLDKLKTLMTKELIVGPDATNATEQLYDLVGDDELFDRLHALADQDPRANCWNDTEVMNRLAELGIELPEPVAPGNPAEPQTGATAPVAAGVPPNPAPDAQVRESLNAMRKSAGLAEAILDESGETLQHILNRFKHEVKNFEANGDLDDDLYHALYDYYSDNGEMPYGTMKARTGDPYNWISDRLADELGINENLIAPMAMPVATEGAGCNMTMEGEYCPEHGLAECGGMYENMSEEDDPGEKLAGAGAGGFVGSMGGLAAGGLPGALAGGIVGATLGNKMATNANNSGTPDETPKFVRETNLPITNTAKDIGATAADVANAPADAIYSAGQNLYHGSDENPGRARGDEDNEIVRNTRKLNDGWKGTLAGSAAGGIAGDIAGQAVGPAAGAALGSAIGGLPGAIAGGAMGAVAGGPVGGVIGGLAGGKIGDKLGGNAAGLKEGDAVLARIKSLALLK